MATDPNEDTIPSPAVSAETPRARPFFRTTPGAFLILALILGSVIALSVIGGYRAGLSERDHLAATAQFDELKRQYDLGIEDLAAGRYLLAAQRFEYILTVAPNFSGAAARLAEARAAATAAFIPTAAPTATPDPQQAPKLFAEAQAAFAVQDWEATIQKVHALIFAAPDYERGQANSMLFTALRNRGIASIQAGKLELGLADLDEAEKIGVLDQEAQQYQQWATIYVAGVSYWGLNWPKTVETFQLLYTLAPNFRDTTARLRSAHVSYANALAAGGDPCGAAAEYAAALEVVSDQTITDRQGTAQAVCATGTPTPEGLPTETPTATWTPMP